MIDEHREAVHAICRKIWNREVSADAGLEELEDVIMDITSEAQHNLMLEMSEMD